MVNHVMYFFLGFFVLMLCAVAFFRLDRVWATCGLPWMAGCLVEFVAILSVHFVGVLYDTP